MISIYLEHLWRNKEVDFDADQFFKEMESVMNCPGEAANSNIEEGSSSDLDFGKIFMFMYTSYSSIVIWKLFI